MKNWLNNILFKLKYRSAINQLNNEVNMDEIEKLMDKLIDRYPLDERVIKPSKLCDACSKNLEIEIGNILYYSKSSKRWLCYDCYREKLLNEDIIFFKSIEDGMAEMIRTRPLPSGPDIGNKKIMLDSDMFLNKHNKKCDHSVKYFNESKLIFCCVDCHEWICASCIDKHRKHAITGYPKIDSEDQLIQVLPYKYESILKSKDLFLNIVVPKEITLNEKFNLGIEFNNMGKDPIYDVDIYFGLHSTVFDASTEDDTYEISKIAKVDVIKQNTVINENYRIGLTNIEITSPKEIRAMISIYYKDFFDASGYQEYKFKTFLVN